MILLAILCIAASMKAGDCFSASHWAQGVEWVAFGCVTGFPPAYWLTGKLRL